MGVADPLPPQAVAAVTEVRRRIKASQAQEARGAKQHGGRVRPGSGSQAHAKGDVRTSTTAGAAQETKGLLLEYKRTDGRGIRVDDVMLGKIWREALLEGRDPVLGLEIGGARVRMPRDWVCIPVEDYVRLKECSSGDAAG